MQDDAGATTLLTRKVFIVHGHDETMKEAVARALVKLDLEPVILHEQPNKGRTINDFAYAKDSDVDNKKSRARQNVILELGYFIGKLGREHVLPLYKEEPDFEIPSDYSGVLFTSFDNKGMWQLNLVKELKACGFEVDANKLLM